MKYNDKNHAFEMVTPSEIAKLKWYYNLWLRTEQSITDAYKKPSYDKHDAFVYFRDEAYDYFDWVNNVTVLTHNTFTFTMGYTFEDNDKHETCFMYITPTYKRYCSIAKLR